MVKIYKENETIYMEDGDDIIECTKIVHEAKTGKDWVVLPENSANRKVADLAKITEEGIELKYRETRTIGARTSGKKLQDYMTDEERATIDAIMEKCKQRKEADKPAPKTEIEKLQEQIAKYQAKIAKLTEAGE